MNIFKEVKNGTDIRDVARDYLNLHFDRSNKINCIWHDDNTPSLSLNVKGKYLHCFGCNKTVDVIDIVCEARGYVKKIDAVKDLIQRYGLSSNNYKSQNKFDHIVHEKAIQTVKEIKDLELELKEERILNEIKNVMIPTLREDESVIEVLKLISELTYPTNRSDALKFLKDKTKRPLSELRKGLDHILKEKKESIKTTDQITEKNIVYTATFDGLVDLVLHNDDVAFLVKDNNELKIKDSILIDDVLYKPPPKKQIPIPCLPRAEKVLNYYENDTDSELFDSLRDYHKRTSELPNENHYDLLTIWDFHTYLIEKFNYSPLIWLFALPERGKSRTGKACINVAYRGIHVESLRDSFIIRATNDLGATLFFDVMDIWRKAEKNGSEDILLQRFEKGTLVPRVLYPEKGAFNDTKYFKIYGATIVATNVPVHNILETRALMLSMPQTDKTFEDDIEPEIALPLKERLVAFRARAMEKTLPTVAKPLKGRLGDILRPLLQIVELVKPDKVKSIDELIKQFDIDRKIQKSESFEATLLSNILILKDSAIDDLLSIKKITDKYNEGLNEKVQVTTNKVGWRLNAMGFKKRKLNTGSHIELEDSKINNLVESLGLNIDFDKQKENDEKNRENTAETSAQKRHKRHKRHLGNNTSGLSGDDNSDDLKTITETSQDRHSANPTESRPGDEVTTSDDIPGVLE